jgi:hypothetical protein
MALGRKQRRLSAKKERSNLYHETRFLSINEKFIPEQPTPNYTFIAQSASTQRRNSRAAAEILRRVWVQNYQMHAGQPQSHVVRSLIRKS